MRIGITGSIAMGKSVVSNYLRELGYRVIDSDLISKQILDEADIINRLKLHFEENIIDKNSPTHIKVDRKKLGELIFSNYQDRIFLNSLVHPRIIEEIAKESLTAGALVFIDIPLLYEAELEDLVDKVIVIYTSTEKQLERLMARDKISEEYALRKIHSQMDIKIKMKKADYLINNNDDLNSTLKQIDNILRSLQNEI